ncbi:type VI immunity family protein [Sorangium sp. So ce1014]|uniref:type VI immunity family protein n=1 Tax=Sorangium sp. So ce1014 TaxID=3133326 RepID=UPI003F6280D5
MTHAASSIEPGEPLASENGVPKVYSALGAFFHCELVEPDDEARFDRVNELVLGWFGPRLRWSSAPFLRTVPAFRQTDLDYVSGYCRTLELPRDPPIDRQAALDFHFGRNDYSIHFGGGRTAAAASPYSYGFWATFFTDPPEERFRVCPVLSLTVPDTWPHQDFAARVSAIAAELRLRWAAAGLTYATWDVYGYKTSDEAIYKHARRFHGYDVPHYLNATARLHDAIRSVNWLTFVGPALAERLRQAGKKLESAGPLVVSPVGTSVLLRAGDRPERGDINRLQVPPAYVAADALVRPVRAGGTAAESLVFFGSPWSVPETSDWLQRFGQGGVLPPAPSTDDIPF